MSEVERKLQERGLSVPAAAKSLADYVPVSRSGNLVFVSGQLPVQDGKLALKLAPKSVTVISVEQ